MRGMSVILSFIVGLLPGLFLGWLLAHNVVASECRLLEGFYVGNQVYYCMEKP